MTATAERVIDGARNAAGKVLHVLGLLYAPVITSAKDAVNKYDIQPVVLKAMTYGGTAGGTVKAVLTEPTTWNLIAAFVTGLVVALIVGLNELNCRAKQQVAHETLYVPPPPAEPKAEESRVADPEPEPKSEPKSKPEPAVHPKKGHGHAKKHSP